MNSAEIIASVITYTESCFSCKLELLFFNLENISTGARICTGVEYWCFGNGILLELLPEAIIFPRRGVHCVTCVFWGGIWDEPARWTSCSNPRTSSGGSAWRGGGWSETAALACPHLLSNCVCDRLGNQKRKSERGCAENKKRSARWPGFWSPAVANHRVLTEPCRTTAAKRKPPEAECNHSLFTCPDSPLWMPLTGPILLTACRQ